METLIPPHTERELSARLPPESFYTLTPVSGGVAVQTQGDTVLTTVGILKTPDALWRWVHGLPTERPARPLPRREKPPAILGLVDFEL